VPIFRCEPRKTLGLLSPKAPLSEKFLNLASLWGVRNAFAFATRRSEADFQRLNQHQNLTHEGGAASVRVQGGRIWSEGAAYAVEEAHGTRDIALQGD